MNCAAGHPERIVFNGETILKQTMSSEVFNYRLIFGEVEHEEYNIVEMDSLRALQKFVPHYSGCFH